MGRAKGNNWKERVARKIMIMQVIGKNEEGRQGKAMGAFFVGQIIDSNVMCLDLVNLFPGNHCLKV